ncbi:NrdH-redoxin [Candidatus Woesearchaeota archaeon]|jgi:glutaredoxin 3|nr:NrdH-redoxin [Candidatus Woesearchaeota archaeon]MBT5739803.1 NrdH-redoxin [Candidatus Woesearchaeota archaeon]
MVTVKVYTTPTCGWCKKTKEFLKEKGVKFVEKDVTTDDKARDEAVEKSGQMGVPVIDIDGKILVGFNPKKIEEALG